MKENLKTIYDEEWAALIEARAGKLFANLPILANGLEVSPDEPSNGFKNVIEPHKPPCIPGLDNCLYCGTSDDLNG